MDDDQRLLLIAESVTYCQKVKAMGMPSRCYTKALREPIFFLWEMRKARKKELAAQYRSRKSLGLAYGKGEIIYDHAIPFRYLQDELLTLDEVTPVKIREALNKHCVAAIITREENSLLSREGLQYRMPENWNGQDPLARYRAVGIDIMENPLSKNAFDTVGMES